MRDEGMDTTRDIGIGVVLSILLNIALLIVGAMIGWLVQLALGPLGSLLVFGLNGVGYVTVMVLAVKEARRRGRPRVGKGIIIGLVAQFSLAVLLVVACFGIFFLMSASSGWGI